MCFRAKGKWKEMQYHLIWMSVWCLISWMLTTTPFALHAEHLWLKYLVATCKSLHYSSQFPTEPRARQTAALQNNAVYQIFAEIAGGENVHFPGMKHQRRWKHFQFFGPAVDHHLSRETTFLCFICVVKFSNNVQRNRNRDFLWRRNSSSFWLLYLLWLLW